MYPLKYMQWDIYLYMNIQEVVCVCVVLGGIGFLWLSMALTRFSGCITIIIIIIIIIIIRNGQCYNLWWRCHNSLIGQPYTLFCTRPTNFETGYTGIAVSVPQTICPSFSGQMTLSLISFELHTSCIVFWWIDSFMYMCSGLSWS